MDIVLEPASTATVSSAVQRSVDPGKPASQLVWKSGGAVLTPWGDVMEDTFLDAPGQTGGNSTTYIPSVTSYGYLMPPQRDLLLTLPSNISQSETAPAFLVLRSNSKWADLEAVLLAMRGDTQYVPYTTNLKGTAALEVAPSASAAEADALVNTTAKFCVGTALGPTDAAFPRLQYSFLLLVPVQHNETVTGLRPGTDSMSIAPTMTLAATRVLEAVQLAKFGASPTLRAFTRRCSTGDLVWVSQNAPAASIPNAQLRIYAMDAVQYAAGVAVVASGTGNWLHPGTNFGYTSMSGANALVDTNPVPNFPVSKDPQMMQLQTANGVKAWTANYPGGTWLSQFTTYVPVYVTANVPPAAFIAAVTGPVSQVFDSSFLKPDSPNNVGLKWCPAAPSAFAALSSGLAAAGDAQGVGVTGKNYSLNQ